MSEEVDLPDFDPAKTYLVSGDTLNEISSTVNRNRVRPIEGGGININDVTDDGTWLGIIAPPSGGTYVLGVIDGTVQWIETDTCA